MFASKATEVFWIVELGMVSPFEGFLILLGLWVLTCHME